MGKNGRKNLDGLVGRTVGELSLAEREHYRGVWVATRRYEPQATLDTLHIRASGETPQQCRQALAAAGEDPDLFEYQQIVYPRLPSYLS
jgi:hypothetical protein